MNKTKLSDLEVEDLVRHLFQLNEEDDYLDTLDNTLFEEWGIDFDTFKTVVSQLLPLCEVGTSPLTGKKYRGFATQGSWLVKEEVPVEVKNSK